MNIICRFSITVIALLALAVGPGTAVGTTLEELVSEVLETNPVVIERLRNYNATREDIGIAEAGYYPTLDALTSVGEKYTGRLSNDVTEETDDVFQNSLVLRQNIFNGFSTTEQVNYQMMRTLAAAYSYLEKANDVTLQTVKVFLDLFRQQELLENSEENVNRIAALQEKVNKAYKAGLTPRSEVSKITSSLSLAQSNMTVQRNKLANAVYDFRRVTGRFISPGGLEKPDVEFALPDNIDDASMYALEYNPSLLVGKYNIKGAEALYRESKSKFYPKLDVEASAHYNDNFNEYTGKDDRLQIMLILTYNFFNGGADEAARRSKISKLSQELAVTNDLRRQVTEGMDLSWSAYELAENQIPLLESYQKQSRETLKLYTKEYEVGERSLLDLLATENDLKRANDELISARYNLLLAKYRILDAMGLTIASVLGNVETYYQRVGIQSGRKIPEPLTLPISQDGDGDGVPDAGDLCSGSRNTTGEHLNGCTDSAGIKNISTRVQ
jgi:adhesin transport system outer membrane protein